MSRYVCYGEEVIQSDDVEEREVVTMVTSSFNGCLSMFVLVGCIDIAFICENGKWYIGDSGDVPDRYVNWFVDSINKMAPITPDKLTVVYRQAKALSDFDASCDERLISVLPLNHAIIL